MKEVLNETFENMEELIKVIEKVKELRKDTRTALYETIDFTNWPDGSFCNGSIEVYEYSEEEKEYYVSGTYRAGNKKDKCYCCGRALGPTARLCLECEEELYGV